MKQLFCILLLASNFAHGEASLPASSAEQWRQDLERADVDNDGAVTKEEFIAAHGQQFAKFDRNSDGYLDSNDVPKRMAERRKQNGGGEMLGGQFDADSDGKVSKDDFINSPTTMFDRADTDKNNVLDAKELAAAKAALSARADGRRARKQQ